MPVGEVLLHGVTHFNTCPACEGESLRRREATDPERLVERLLQGRRAS
jgi:hypothetical protein